MLKGIKVYRFSIVITFLSLFFISQASLAQPYVCLPTCSEIDDHFFRLAGINSDTLNNADHIFAITSPGSEAVLEFGIFDGDSEGFWDPTTLPAEFELALIADPLGDGTGTTVLGTWSSDGTFGENTGIPMFDNDWFDIIFPHSPLAMNAEGDFSYIVRVRNLIPNLQGGNAFKVRTPDTGTLVIPAGAPFNLIAGSTFFDTGIVWPNAELFCVDFPPFGFVCSFAESCSGADFTFCDPTDPDCCLFGSTYDGMFTFFFEVPEGTTTIEMADGDLDFGSASIAEGGNLFDDCISPDGVDVDTDDPNTPNDVLPPWAIGTTAVFEGLSTPTSPQDDACNAAVKRSPSVLYKLIDPNGVEHTNMNPSGTEEWETFSISTNPFDPLLYDLEVPDIPAGVWTFKVIGLDMLNLASFRFQFALGSVNPQEGDLRPIPTLSEWGLLAFALFILFVSVYFIRRKRIYN